MGVFTEHSVDSGSLFHFLNHCRIGDLWTFVSISHTVSGRFYYVGKMTDADKIMHPQHFGTDPTDIWIRFNPKSAFESWITFCWNFGIGRGLQSLSALVNSIVMVWLGHLLWKEENIATSVVLTSWLAMRERVRSPESCWNEASSLNSFTTRAHVFFRMLFHILSNLLLCKCSLSHCSQKRFYTFYAPYSL